MRLPFGYEYAITGRVKDPTRAKWHIVRIVGFDDWEMGRLLAFCGVGPSKRMGRDLLRERPACARCRTFWEEATASDRKLLAQLTPHVLEVRACGTS